MIGGALVGNLSGMRFGCSVPSVECSVQCAECAHIDRVGSSAQLPDLILILILNFMPQLRVWLDFLAGNQSAAAAVAALAVALVAALAAAIQVEAI